MCGFGFLAYMLHDSHDTHTTNRYRETSLPFECSMQTVAKQSVGHTSHSMHHRPSATTQVPPALSRAGGGTGTWRGRSYRRSNRLNSRRHHESSLYFFDPTAAAQDSEHWRGVHKAEEPRRAFPPSAGRTLGGIGYINERQIMGSSRLRSDWYYRRTPRTTVLSTNPRNQEHAPRYHPIAPPFK